MALVPEGEICMLQCKAFPCMQEVAATCTGEGWGVDPCPDFEQCGGCQLLQGLVDTTDVQCTPHTRWVCPGPDGCFFSCCVCMYVSACASACMCVCLPVCVCVCVFVLGWRDTHNSHLPFACVRRLQGALCTATDVSHSSAAVYARCENDTWLIAASPDTQPEDWADPLAGRQGGGSSGSSSSGGVIAGAVVGAAVAAALVVALVAVRCKRRGAVAAASTELQQLKRRQDMLARDLERGNVLLHGLNSQAKLTQIPR